MTARRANGVLWPAVCAAAWGVAAGGCSGDDGGGDADVAPGDEGGVVDEGGAGDDGGVDAEAEAAPEDGGGEAEGGDEGEEAVDDGGGDGLHEVDIAVCDPAAGPFSLTIDNPYFPLPVGQVLVLDGTEGSTAVHLDITVLDETEVVEGVTTRVMEERESEDGELVEVSRNFFVQAPDGTVCYYGEDVDIYEGGEVVGHSGQWRAGGGNLPGIMMPASPEVGMTYAQEMAPGVAEDHADIVAMGESITVPLDTYTDTLRTSEWTPLEAGRSTKVYVSGIGLVVDDILELTAVTAP
jgi:hypothetical protein